MEFKVGLVFLAIASLAHGVSIGDVGVKATDYGPEIAATLNGIIQSLPDPDPVVLIGADGKDKIHINLTKVKWDTPNYINGSLDINSVSVTGLKGIKIVKSSAIFYGLFSPFSFDILLSGSSITLKATYAVDAHISQNIPVLGAGFMTVNTEGLKVGIKGNLTNLHTKLKLRDFDFILDIKNIRVVIDGLLGDPVFSDAVGKLAEDLIQSKLLDPIKDALNERHQMLVSQAKDIFNGFELTLSDLLKLLKPKPTKAPSWLE